MSRRVLVQGFTLGLAAGVVLGLFLRTVQQLTGSQVYTLLLNIDFLPVADALGLLVLPEWFEFTLHLIVSLLLGIVYVGLVLGSRSPWTWGWLLGLLPSLLYIPLTQLSDRVPDLYDAQAIGWWLAGHFLYSLVLIGAGITLQRKN
ncbi:hypothetical protein RAC89_14765 [Paenibacillus sp. GD4]|uniref:hypothetical protein n=1 Tax=Paenibacillus sp. GD4 TaxID=3068890 RepID=UPI002796E215|nr:hypothetical protein [Paenibacillus sp. GD4]MDQ1911664.1 hypothetical protein [Paenibacillus sp. GD4]